jgi:hypothetical protein
MCSSKKSRTLPRRRRNFDVLGAEDASASSHQGIQDQRPNAGPALGRVHYELWLSILPHAQSQNAAVVLAIVHTRQPVRTNHQSMIVEFSGAGLFVSYQFSTSLKLAASSIC